MQRIKFSANIPCVKLNSYSAKNKKIYISCKYMMQRIQVYRQVYDALNFLQCKKYIICRRMQRIKFTAKYIMH